MIDYDPSGFSFGTLLALTGSVIPAGVLFAFPCGVLGGCVCALKNSYSFGYEEVAPENSHHLATYMAFNSILGFLIIFRTQNAYSRFWEGTTLLQQVRGEWYSAISSMFAFFSTAAEKKEEVETTKHLLIRLMSLMYCAGLQSVTVISDIDFEVIDTQGMDKEQLVYMSYSPEPPLVILQWLQQVIVSSIRKGTTDIPAPIVSRVFQELSNGLVHLQNVAKISDTLFPFAYAQMITAMLMIQFCLAPVYTAAITDSVFMASLGSFMTVFLTACMNLIASEIEMPFGDDPNDLEVRAMQQALNANLVTLMDPRTCDPPHFELQQRAKFCRVSTWMKCVSPADDLAVLGVRKGAFLKAKTEEGLEVDIPSPLGDLTTFEDRPRGAFRAGATVTDFATGQKTRHRRHRQRRLRRLRKVVQPVLPTLMTPRRQTDRPVTPSQRRSMQSWERRLSVNSPRDNKKRQTSEKRGSNYSGEKRLSGASGDRRLSLPGVATSPPGSFSFRGPSAASECDDSSSDDAEPTSITRSISGKVLNFFTAIPKPSRIASAPEPPLPASAPEPHHPPEPPPPNTATESCNFGGIGTSDSEPLREAHEIRVLPPGSQEVSFGPTDKIPPFLS